jgi:chromate reductase, NAD(P)H dehydrogenase (quinone)
MNHPLNILGIPGSLRKGSHNPSVLRAAQQLATQGTALEIFELGEIAPFNQDEERNPPERVPEFKQKIRAADAI